MKPFYLYAPIRRVDDSERTVEGYAFVREVVEGEGGLRLTRAAMERATPDYMQWGALREMHQPQAAGTTTEIQWDEQGAYIRTRIVDDSAWKKVVERVYKGFSVGVQGLVLRGNQVTACRWIEISLVDRPKDPGAIITAFRAADFEAMPRDDAASDEMEMPAMPDGPAENDVPSNDAIEGCDAARNYDADITNGIAEKPLADRTDSNALEGAKHEPGLEEDEFASVSAPEKCRASRGSPPGENDVSRMGDYDDDMTRVEMDTGEMSCDNELHAAPPGQSARHAASADVAGAAPEMDRNRLASANAQLLRRAESAETELARARAQLAAATERVRFLEAQPKSAKPVVRFPGALNRDFLANHAAGETASRVAELRTERATLLSTAPSLTAQADRAAAAQRLMAIDGELRMLG
jgi:hypothetical protein